VGRVSVWGSWKAAALPTPRVVPATDLDQAVKIISLSSGEGWGGAGVPGGDAPEGS